MVQRDHIDVGESPIKFVPVKSKRFLCGRCLDRLIEITPVVRRGQGRRVMELTKRMKEQGQVPRLQVKLKCPRGCHDKPGFTFQDIGDKSFIPKKFTPDRRAQREIKI